MTCAGSRSPARRSARSRCGCARAPAAGGSSRSCGASVPAEPAMWDVRTRPGLRALLGVAIAVSVVHYTDNFVNYDDYPQPTSGPAPSAGLVLGSWFLFTAFAIAGY